MKVLIVEDDTQLNIAITEFFKINSYKTVSVKDGLDAIDKIDNETFDLYIIDINIPNCNGLDITSYIRKINIDTPIIIVTASLEIENLTTAFANGCNEYIKKPFHIKELEVRVNNLLYSKQTNNIFFKDDFYYDLNTHQFYYQNKPIELRYKEKKLCKILMQNINNVVLGESIYSYVWEGMDKDTYPIRQLLSELRKKLPYNIVKTKVKEGYFIKSM